MRAWRIARSWWYPDAALREASVGVAMAYAGTSACQSLAPDFASNASTMPCGMFECRARFSALSLHWRLMAIANVAGGKHT